MAGKVKIVRVNNGSYDPTYETTDGKFEIVKEYFGMNHQYTVYDRGYYKCGFSTLKEAREFVKDQY
jgi:hypothetical protein